MDSVTGMLSCSAKYQFDSGKAEGAQEGKSFSKSVKHSGDIYTHIELGAGNYRHRNGDVTEYSPCQDKGQVHIETCSCDGCDYSKNRYRYAVLESTIHHIVTQTSQPIKRFILNDIDCISLDQSVKHARKYIKFEFNDLQQRISVEGIHGDFYKIKFSEFNPASIHLKNPENYFFQDASVIFESTTAKLFRESSSCNDGGFILVTTEANGLKLKATLKSQSSSFVVEPYELPYDTSYHGLQFSASDLWNAKPLAYLCKQTTSAT